MRKAMNKLTAWRSRTIKSFAALTIAAALPVAAWAESNVIGGADGGFESGFTGMATTGDASIVPNLGVMFPTQGGSAAVLTTEPDAGGTLADADTATVRINGFLVPTDATTLRLDYSFLTNEPNPSLTNDRFVVTLVLVGPATETTLLAVDTFDTFTIAPWTGYDAQTGRRTLVADVSALADDGNTYDLELRVEDIGDGRGDSAVLIDNLRFGDGGDPLAIAGFDILEADVDEVIRFDGLASTDDVGIASYDWVFGNGFIGNGGLIDLAYADPGIYFGSLTVTDDDSNTSTDSFVVVVGNQINSAPVISSVAPDTAFEGGLFSYDVEVDDTEVQFGDEITFSLDEAPAGMTIDPATGLIEWTPASGDPTVNSVTVRATDSEGLFDLQAFVVTIETKQFIVVTDDNSFIYVSESNGDGTWGPMNLIAQGAGQIRGAAINDFDNDGDMDILVPWDPSFVAVHFYRNDGNNNFTDEGVVADVTIVSSQAYGMTTGDYDSDGNADFIINLATDRFVIGYGDGAGGFSLQEFDDNLGTKMGIDTADFNHDGNVDYVWGRSNGQINVRLGDGGGGFGGNTVIGDTGNNPYAVTAGDFNEDGHVDVIANNSSSGDGYLFAGDGLGGFAAGVYIGSIDFGNYGKYDNFDFNGDGHLDLITSSYSSRTIRFYPGNGDGTFGAAVTVGNDRNNSLGVSAPPAPNGSGIDPRPRILPDPLIADVGVPFVFDGSASTDDGSIVSYEWDFGDGGSGSGVSPSHTYAAEGRYNVRLRVTDDIGFSQFTTATIRVQDAAPVAVSGGPYVFGEETATLGTFTVTLDGTGSSDVPGPITYEWDLDTGLEETFDGPDLDPDVWVGNGASVSGGQAVVVGNGWGNNGYLATVDSHARQSGDVYTARITTPPGTGYMMWGLKNTNDDFTYTQLYYAIYFNNGTWYVYENGGNRGSFGTYTRGETYDVRIQVHGQGATYAIRPAGETEWTFLFATDNWTDSPFRVSADANSNTWLIDDISIPTELATDPTPTLTYSEPGTYNVALSVTDTAGQTSTDATTVTLEVSDPPVADAGGTYTLTEAAAVCNVWTVTLDGTASTDDVAIGSYEWTFSDGGTATGATPTHAFTGAGPHTATLTVTDNGLQTSSDTATILTTVQDPPVASFSGEPYFADETDASAGLWTINFGSGGSSDDNGICDYAWSFGDGGTATGPSPSHQYGSTGTFTVSLTVRDHGHQATTIETTAEVTQTLPPVAEFVGSPYAADEGAADEGLWTVDFDASASTDDISIWKYEWDFGDGNAGSTVAPTHQYDAPGVYDVTVRVFDQAGQSTLIGTTATISVNDPPVPDIDAPDVAGEAFAFGGTWTVPFDATGSTDDFGIWTYEWDFGDGATGTGPTLSHDYTVPGTYEVSLTVTDHGEQAVTATHTLEVVTSTPPVADTGGPYVFGEESATNGIWKVQFDGSGSTDDVALFDYLWTYPTVVIDEFDGTVVDSVKWSASGVTQDGNASISGVGSWTNRYLYGNEPITPKPGQTLFMTITPESPTSTQTGMFGFKRAGTDANYTNFPLALYFVNDNLNIYRFGSNLGAYGNYVRGETYELRWDFAQGNTVSASIRPVGTLEWSHLGTVTNVGANDLVPAATINRGTFIIDNIYAGNTADGAAPKQYFAEETSFDVTLRVRDNALQEHSDTSSVVVEMGNPPVADAGGPYIVEQGMLVALNSTASDDDVNIEQYIWDFGDGSTSRVANPQKFFDELGTHTVTLTVKDNVLQEDTTTTTVEVVLGNAPVADAGGPYEGGAGGPAVFFDGGDSTDDHGIANYFWDVDAGVDSDGDGNFTNDRDYVGQKVNHVYSGTGTYTATLRVVDGPGQEDTDSISVSVLPDLPPRVVTVPWVGSDVSIPHEIYNGKQTTLKGVAYDGNLLEYEWDFGDGTTSGKIAANSSNWFKLEAAHTYPDVPANTPFVARLTVWDTGGNSSSDTYNIIVKPKSLTTEVNVAIDEGLWHLHKIQTKTGASRGQWVNEYSSAYYASSTGSSINTFVANAHKPNGDPAEDPYVETVRWGFDNLFTLLRTEDIPTQLRGEPDVNGNGIGIRVNSGRYTYEGGMVMDAIISSGTPLRAVTTSHNSFQQIRTMRYWDVVQEMVESYAYGQADGVDCGAWVYGWYNNSNGCHVDNSASQWAAIGIIPAERVFNNKVPQFIKTQYTGALHNTQHTTLGRIGYSSVNGAWGEAATTPSGMIGYAMTGMDSNAERWGWAEAYSRDTFNVTSGNNALLLNYYGQFAMSKAMRLALPVRQEILCEFCGPDGALDWYGDPDIGLAYNLINRQEAEGGWTQPSGLSGSSYWRPGLVSPWAVLILTRELFEVAPVADAGRDRVWGVSRPDDPRPLTLDGSSSFHPDPFRSIVRYEWDVDGDGSFDSSSSDPFFTHEYLEADYPETVLPQNITVTLRVTDDAGKTDTDTSIVLLAVPPHPPFADAGPKGGGLDDEYTCTQGIPCTLDGTDSFDIDPTDFIAVYGWELDGVGVPDFDEALGGVIQHTFTEVGEVTIGLRVLDDGRFNDLDGDEEVDENERLSDQDFVVVNVVPNLPPVADPGGPYVIDEGQTVAFDGTASFDPNGDPITHEWDLDEDGTFEAAGATPTQGYNDDGVYTAALRVSDGLLSDVRSVDVTVNDLAPSANFDWSPDPQDEGGVVAFSDLSTTGPDAIVAWAWDFDGLDTRDQQNPSFTFPTDGTYEVSLMVTDDDGSTDLVSMTVTISDLSPTAGFTAAPQPQDEGSAVAFTDTSTSPVDDIVEWAWDFDGLDSSTEQNPSFTFVEDGTYDVTLTVTDSDGSTDSVTNPVVIANVAPIVDAGPDQTVTEGDTVNIAATFNDPGAEDTHTIAIDWGDGSPVDEGSLSGSHVYPDDGVFTVTVTVTDDDGGVGSDTLTVTVGNADPVVTAGDDQTIVEGGSISLDPATFTDAGVEDTHTASIDWGDGSSAEAGSVTQAAGSGTVDGSHIFADDGVFTVTVTVTDDEGGVGSDTFTVTVDNADPVVDAGEDQTLGDGSLLVSLDPATFTDAGDDDTHTASIDWGDGTVTAGTVGQAVGGGTVGGSHTYTDNGIFTVTVTVTDDDGGSGSDTFTVSINSSVLVVVDAGAPVTVVEGTNVPLAPSTFSHDGIGGVLTATIDWGDGTPAEAGTVTPNGTNDGGTVDGSHVYPDDGLHTVVVTVLQDGTPVGTDSFTVTVNNADPDVDAGADQTIAEGGSVSLDPATFADAGVEDTHTATIDWGDGSPVEAGSLTQGVGSGSVDGGHAYPQDGVFTVTVTVTDDDGGVGSDTFTVTVNDIPPEVNAREDRTITEGDILDVEPWGFTDDGVDDTHTATIDWGEGTVTPAPVTETAEGGFVGGTFTYPENGVFDVTVTVTTVGTGATGTDTFVLTVLNADPVVTARGDVTVPQGSSVDLAPTAFTDAGVEDTHTATVDWGEGAGPEAAGVTQGAGSGSVSGSHVFDTPGTFTVAVAVTDDDGGAGSDTFMVTVEGGAAPEQTIFDLSGRARDSSLDLVWTHVPDAVYNIYRATTSGGPYELIAAGHVSTYSVYADSGLTNGVTYFYVVRSVVDGVESLDSNEAALTPEARRRRR